MKKNILLLIFTILINIAGFGQQKYNADNVSKDVKDIVDSISDSRIIYFEDCSSVSDDSRDFDLCQKFAKKASVVELLELINHQNAIVRCYSFYLLTMIDCVNLFPIVISHFNDNVCVNKVHSCVIRFVMNNYTVSDFFIEITTSSYFKGCRKLTSSQIEHIDSLLIYNSKYKLSRDDALMRVIPTEKRYKRIKRIYKKENDGEALIALAKYQKEQDIPIILNSANQVYDKSEVFFAISYFPNQAFMPLLKAQMDDFRFPFLSFCERNFYQAIACYKNDEAKELIGIALKKLQNIENSENRIYYLLEAIQNNIDVKYIEIMYELWECNYITPDIFRFLKGIDPKKTLEYTKESLKDSIPVYHNYRGEEGEKEDTLIFLMLDLVLQNDSSFGIQIINNQIVNAQNWIFHVFAKEASILKNPKFIEPLLNVLKNDEHYWLYEYAAESLISYNDPIINKKMIEIGNNKVNTRSSYYINQVLIKYNLK